MKKIIAFTAGLLILTGAGCSSGNGTAPVSNQPGAWNAANDTGQPAAPENRYFVLEKNKYVGGHLLESAALLYDHEGFLQKTLPLPADMVKGIAGNIQTFGDVIYYLSGTVNETSIGRMSAADGKTTHFDFTRSVNTNVGNVLSGIISWTISDKSRRVAWLDTTGRISVASIDGSDRRVFQTNNRLVIGWLQFSPDGGDLYWWVPGGSSPDIMKWHLADNSQTAIAGPYNNLNFALSPSANYLAAHVEGGPPDGGDLIIKNLDANTSVTVPLEKKYDLYNDLVFSPDGHTLIAAEQVMGGAGQFKAVKINSDTGARSDMSTNASVVDYVSDNTIVLYGRRGSISTAAPDGTNLQKISTEPNIWYVGFVTAR